MINWQKPNLFSFKNLYNAYINCRKHKRGTYQAIKFELKLEQELLNISQELQSHNYYPSPSTCFAVTDPKLREVWAADFRDRVVHHLLIQHLESIWEKMFVFHSCACRKKKGAHKAVSSLKKCLQKDLFFYQADIQSFFISIDKNILYSLIKRRVKNPEILWLAKTIIFHNPTHNYIQKGDLKLLQSIPIHKSLFEKYDCGLPIGNLTSQFFANLYLNELDQFMKHKLKCKKYFRYMDDFILVHSSQKQLLKWRTEIKNFAKNNLNLKIHPKKEIFQPVRCGINFCGYIIKPTHILIRRRTVKKLKNKLWYFNQKILKNISPDQSIASEILFNNPYIIF
ncbi:RNA-directed DNA polymerase, partial [Patescibacteria group bacterium]|nr:RNA-directed DNA polymerase [Patescibacteria group bacterium]